MAGRKPAPQATRWLDQVRALYTHVSAEPVSEELVLAAQKVWSPPLQPRIGMMVCESNSCRLATAMASLNRASEIAVVGGLAFPFGVGLPDPSTPRAHVWVREADKHLDITWPLFGPIAAVEYYPMRELSVPGLKGSYAPGLLNIVKEIARHHGIDYL